AAKAEAEDELPPQLLHQHVGHRKGRVTDFQWHPTDPWVIMSVSENCAGSDDEAAADGSLQVWRISDLVYRPAEEVVAELEEHRQFIMRGTSPADKDKGREKDKAAKSERDKAETDAAS
ncbi:hypothetical protein Agub_g4372, partial [Astrephomene gubernaculifera]